MGAGHEHDTAGSNRVRLGIAFAITATVLAAEVVGVWTTGSLALLVDAGHMFTDAGGLLMALLAATAMTKPPTARRTWGWARIEILAAGAQAAILLAVGPMRSTKGCRGCSLHPRSPPAAGYFSWASSVWSPTSPPSWSSPAAGVTTSTCARRSSKAGVDAMPHPC